MTIKKEYVCVYYSYMFKEYESFSETDVWAFIRIVKGIRNNNDCRITELFKVITNIDESGKMQYEKERLHI